MVKLLKFSVFVNLLLACGAGWFAYKQFLEREIIKNRMLRLEESAAKIAGNLKADDAVTRSLAANIKDMNGMNTPLSDLERHATARQQDLEATKEDLAQTKAELASTKDKLAATETQLANTIQELEATRTELASTKVDLNAARDRIESLGVEIADLKTQINTLNETVQNKEDQIAKLDGILNTTAKELDRVKRELRICQIGQQGSNYGELENKEAQVILVNKDWNFMVIDLGREDYALLGAVGLIRRGDQLIGKAVITSVEEKISVADVRLDTLEPGAEVRVGDLLWFAPSTL
jgi:chromosome segregation ATPase